MKRLVFAGLALGLAIPATTQDGPPKLNFPVDCTIGENCWIARYMDRAPGRAKADYTCNSQTEDKHKGTDIALADTGAMAKGVAVKAAADGRVIALRGGMPDIRVTKQRAKTIQKQGCGNILVVGHGNGWQTSYCHLKNDSLLVKEGDRVTAGQAIAQVGLSGLTEFPHLHFMVSRTKKGRPIQNYDPFDGGLLEGGCKATEKSNAHKKQTSFWSEPISYASATLMPPLVSDVAITRQTLWQVQAEKISRNAPVLFVQARGFHAVEGDIWRFSLFEPSGRKRFTHDVKQTRNRQLVEANANFKMPDGGFLHGRWRATVELLRGGQSMGKQTTSVVIE